MGKKLYEKTETGGIRFSSERKPGEVRVPNYVYDLWLPLLGAVAVGVYNLYCRLERENIVKAISLKNIANACRIGTDRLDKINETLKKCGFIEIAKPTGWKRLAHYTTEIKVLDPPREVPIWAIEEYATEQRGYEPLTPWLVAEEIKTPTGSPENPFGFSGEPEQGLDKNPDGTPKIATLGLQPSGVESLDVEADISLKNPDPIVEAIIEQTETRPGPCDLGLVTEQAQAQIGSWTAPPPAGGDDAAARAGIGALAKAKGSRPPREGSGGYVQQLEHFRQPLKDQGEQDPEVAALASQLFVEEKPAMANPYYSSFRGDYGDYLGRAREILDKRRAKSPSGDYEPVYGSDPEPLARDDGDCSVGAQVKHELSYLMDKPTFEAKVKPTRFVQVDGVLTVTAPDEAVKGWLADRLARTIQRTAVGVTGDAVEVRFEVAGTPEEADSGN